MFAVLVALILLSAGVAVIYLVLKNMSEDGIDIAAPGSCRRGSCGGSSCRPAKEAEDVEEAPQQTADEGDQGKPK